MSTAERPLTVIGDVDRTSYIGGGDMGDILSLAPYGCRYRAWIEKRGMVEREDISDIGHVKRGVRGEEIAAEEYTAATGRKVRRYQFLRHRDFPYFGAHIDRHIVSFDERGPGVAEIKCPGEFNFRNIRRDGMSEAHIAQINWYLYITGWKWGAFAVFSLERFELVHFDVERDDALIERLANAAQDFHRLLENGPSPEKLDPKDRRCIRCPHRENCHGSEALPEWDGAIEYDPALRALVADYRDAQQINSAIANLLRLSASVLRENVRKLLEWKKQCKECGADIVAGDTCQPCRFKDAQHERDVRWLRG